MCGNPINKNTSRLQEKSIKIYMHFIQKTVVGCYCINKLKNLLVN